MCGEYGDYWLLTAAFIPSGFSFPLQWNGHIQPYSQHHRGEATAAWKCGNNQVIVRSCGDQHEGPGTLPRRKEELNRKETGLRCGESRLQAPLSFPGWARPVLPVRNLWRKGGRGWKGGIAASRASTGLDCPQELAPHLIQQAAAATTCPAAWAAARPTTASATTTSPALCSCRRRHLDCFCVSLPLLLVRSRLAEADVVTRHAESWLTWGCRQEWPRGLPGFVVVRSSGGRLLPTRLAAASWLLRGIGWRHCGAAPKSPWSSQARIPPDRDVAPANALEAEETPEAGAAGNSLPEELESPLSQT